MSSVRQYDKINSIVFRKTTEKFGGLSNMASGFPILWGSIRIKSSEALYQSLRYPNHPDIQQKIIIENSPMTAKMISKKYYSYTRPDWMDVRYKLMRFCLELKLIQNWEMFYPLLKATGKKNIIEYAPEGKDWGAAEKGDIYEGVNALGRLIMELRENYVFNEMPERIYIPEISDIRVLNIDVNELKITMPNIV